MSRLFLGEVKKEEIFRVAGEGYNRNVEREQGRRGREEWEKATEREGTHVLTDLYNCRRSTGRKRKRVSENGVGGGNHLHVRESVIDRADTGRPLIN